MVCHYLLKPDRGPLIQDAECLKFGEARKVSGYRPVPMFYQESGIPLEGAMKRSDPLVRLWT